MQTLLIALLAGVGFIVAYHTYGRWLSRKLFRLDATAETPSRQLNDDRDYVPTAKSIVFGHHFTSIAGTGPIVGPALAIMWDWLPALLWVVFGSILIGAVHDLGALVVSLRNRGMTIGEIAGRVINPRARLLFLFILLFALWVVLAIFGLVIANVFVAFPESILPVFLQLPIAIWIGTQSADLHVGQFFRCEVHGEPGPEIVRGQRKTARDSRISLHADRDRVLHALGVSNPANKEAFRVGRRRQ